MFFSKSLKECYYRKLVSKSTRLKFNNKYLRILKKNYELKKRKCEKMDNQTF